MQLLRLNITKVLQLLPSRSCITSTWPKQEPCNLAHRTGAFADVFSKVGGLDNLNPQLHHIHVHLLSPPLELPPVALHQLSIVPHRPQHQHPTYGHGQYSQKLIRWDAAASGTSTRRCNHPPWNWTGDPWWNPHGEGVQLHKYNIVDMHCHSRRQSLEAILFKDEGCYVPRDLHQTLEGSADSTIWYQMACRGSKYRGFQATCKYCGACSIGAWKRRSTHEWRKHQRANILHFLGYNVHVIASETDCVSGKKDLDYMYMAA